MSTGIDRPSRCFLLMFDGRLPMFLASANNLKTRAIIKEVAPSLSISYHKISLTMDYVKATIKCVSRVGLPYPTPL